MKVDPFGIGGLVASGVRGQAVHKPLDIAFAVIAIAGIIGSAGHGPVDMDAGIHGFHGLVEFNIAPGVVAGRKGAACLPVPVGLVSYLPVLDAVTADNV